ncbi:uncharacterized protein Dwil_GK19686 [Drosophila willistoni]|uniref:Serine/threonine-protein phosphatase PGAM5, mitochondrial n=1 Tax=Drosophila willistoni TaxID=7260 RepID=B4MP28_DROWI|nr:serine/threonine-protein phosphatase Pgam5, mitochondrial [Drosophila willistoni]EDW73867.1 uncharacterized protein Dwil_GK19686 [Drosophila willistoni]
MRLNGIIQSLGALSCGSLVTYLTMRFIDRTSYLSGDGDEGANEIKSKWIYNWDQRGPNEQKKMVHSLSQESNPSMSKSVARRHIFLVRHGEYSDEHERPGYLTDRGRAQAARTGRRLSEMGVSWDYVVASTMPRAMETAMIILKQINFDPLKLKRCDLLCEGTPYPADPPQNRNPRHIQQAYQRDGPRIEAAFRRYFFRAPADQEQDSYMLIIGHANVIRYLVLRALQLPPEAWLRLTLHHGSISWITVAPSGLVSVRSLGDAGFMPINEMTHRKPKQTNKQ